MDLNLDWQNFMNNQDTFVFEDNNTNISDNKEIPSCSSLNISTKSKILFLNKHLDLNYIFWKLNVIDYDTEYEGIIKKQIKFNFLDKSEVIDFEEKIKKEKNVTTKILNKVDNPSGRVKFKDVRKIDVGFSTNDILNSKKKSKSAFYNCIVVIYRKKYNEKFKEFHIKIFNSGKIKIPGIQSENMLEVCKDIIIGFIQPLYKEVINEIKEKRELVLVNSNFNCGYYLNRELLVQLLKTKYNIKCGMDSCSYPGIQCKYKLKTNIEISFMIFRTGSVLIAGKCNDEELNTIYLFLKQMFHDEYLNIHEQQSELEKMEKEKTNKNKKKSKKKFIIYR